MADLDWCICCFLSGESKLDWCGAMANRPAVYFSFVTNAEAFLNVPVLNPIVVKGNIRFHAFLSVDPEPSILRLSKACKGQ